MGRTLSVAPPFPMEFKNSDRETFAPEDTMCQDIDTNDHETLMFDEQASSELANVDGDRTDFLKDEDLGRRGHEIDGSENDHSDFGGTYEESDIGSGKDLSSVPGLVLKAKALRTNVKNASTILLQHQTLHGDTDRQ